MSNRSGRWLTHPQCVPLRKAIFRLHKWLGLVVGVYVLAMSLSGVALLFYPQIYQALKPAHRSRPGPRLTQTELKLAVQRSHPNSLVSWIWEPADPGSPVEIWFKAPQQEEKYLFDAVTGEELGDSMPWSLQALNSAVQFHRDLTLGSQGKTIQGIGGILLTLICVTGMVIWWPGVSRWLRHLYIRRGARPARMTWEAHSAIGFWNSALLLLISFTGACLALQDLAVIGGKSMRTMYRLHSGTFWGDWPGKIFLLWITVALLTMVVTGAAISWSRLRSFTVRAGQKAVLFGRTAVLRGITHLHLLP